MIHKLIDHFMEHFELPKNVTLIDTKEKDIQIAPGKMGAVGSWGAAVRISGNEQKDLELVKDLAIQLDRKMQAIVDHVDRTESDGDLTLWLYKSGHDDQDPNKLVNFVLDRKIVLPVLNVGNGLEPVFLPPLLIVETANQWEFGAFVTFLVSKR